MPIEFIGMIGVRPEGADGAAANVIGGEIDPAWVRDFSRAHERAGFDKVLVDYYDLGVTTLLIRGFDPLHDAVDYGRELIPLVRREVARRDRAAA